MSCHSADALRKNGAAARPTARLTSVIVFGVTDVVARRRVIASEIRRSKCRDMNPSFCLIRLRSSQASAVRTSPAEESATRPSSVSGSGPLSNTRDGAPISAGALSEAAAAAMTASGRAVSTSTTEVPST